MVEFETVTAKEVKFGKNNFIEVARKKATGEEGEREYISLSRGFYTPDGQRKWKTSITLPDEDDKRQKIADLITTL